MKILVIQMKFIGDVLATSIICNNLKKIYPNSQIDFLVYPFTKPVIENNPNIDTIVFFEEKNRKSKIELIKFLKKFYDEYNIKSSPKGLYLHGSFGSGKTFLLACLLNELEIKKHISYEIVYYPELLRTLKEDLSLVESKVSYYSNVEILVLDDIGAENVTNWGRDEILGTILQERMNKHKTTFFTSNLDINELEKHLSCSKDNVDNVKARRIIERIKQLTIDMPLISVNRRN